MNDVTKWFSNDIYLWMDSRNYTDMTQIMKETCLYDHIHKILEGYPNISLQEVNFHPAGTYQEEEKTQLDNIDDFYEIKMEQIVTPKHKAQFRVYLPARWNHRFMGISGAGTNNEVDWFSAVRFNVISWPMALKNGYACAVSNNDTGIRLDCSWGFDDEGQLEWDHIEAWAHKTMHEMTICAKDIVRQVYGQDAIASYMHGTSGGGREVVTEAIMYPEDYDGLWADAPSIDHVNLAFTCLWAAVVEANEKHIVALSKYKKAREIALKDPALYHTPFHSSYDCWRNFISGLYGLETEDGPITRRDVQVMVKTWEGPVLEDGRKVAYGFGPTIRQWPLPTGNPMYGYFQRMPNGKYFPMPIAEQYFRWFVGKADYDIHSCNYEEFTEVYNNYNKRFENYSYNECDYTPYARKGGKLIITQGTGDCVVPYEQMMDYYMNALEHFPSERIFNDTFRLFMPELAGHSILDWSGPAVSIADGMKALTSWVEKNEAPEEIPTMLYDFAKEEVVEAAKVELYNQWKYKRKIKSLTEQY